MTSTAAALALAAVLGAAQGPEPQPASAPTVVFVCERGAWRSPIAAAWFDRLAREKGLPHRAVFRGANPSGPLAAAAREGLQRDGLDVPEVPPVAVTTDDVAKAERIVAMGCAIPGREALAAKVVDWEAVPGSDVGYEAARDDIRARVQKLVDELAATASP